LTPSRPAQAAAVRAAPQREGSDKAERAAAAVRAFANGIALKN
jgi:hypothetical protein